MGLNVLKLTTFFSLSLTLAWSVHAQNLSFSVEKSKLGPKGGELHFLAPAGHHFNSEAPNKVLVSIGSTESTSWRDADKVEIKGNELTATWAGEKNFCRGVVANLFVCDDQNSYCVPLRQSYSCSGDHLVPLGAASGSAPGVADSGSAGAGAGGGSDNSSATGNASVNAAAMDTGPAALPSGSGSDQGTENGGTPKNQNFIMNDPLLALSRAKAEHKPLLIDFFAIWCPPCNQLDEEVFDSPDFEKLSPQFVLLKLDADGPVSWSMKSKFTITGYPTVIMANEKGEEVNRVLGFRGKSSFIATMKRVLAGKGLSFEQNKIEADEKNSEKAAYEVGLTYLERQDYVGAEYYLYKASRGWSLGDIRRNKLLSATLGLQQIAAHTDEEKKLYEQFLLSALEWYPRQPEVFDRADDLTKVAEDLGDKVAQDKAREVLVSTALWYLGHPKARAQTDNSRGDLYELLGETYEAIGAQENSAEKSKEAFAKGAEEYLKEITKAKLDPDSERGYNLERVYCLWKSGQQDQADALYEKLEKLYPREFTFHYQHGRLLSDAKDYKRAQPEAQSAYQYSYGDNKLRAAGLLAEVDQNLGQKKEAFKVLDDTIKNFQLPGDKNIRTHRYYDKLVDLRKILGGK